MDEAAPFLPAGELAGLLAEPDRLRVVAALVLGARTTGEVRAATGLDARRATTALGRLQRAGLVEAGEDGTLVLLAQAFPAAARAARAAGEGGGPNPPDEHGDQPPDRSRILRTFVRDGRLQRMPTAHAKRLVVLDLVVQDFEPGRRYPEREVNRMLRTWFDDVAALRRWLVDVGYLDRDRGDYWRSGGTVTAGTASPGGSR